MDIPQISHDDVTDVMELTDKLETQISEALAGNNINIAVSALMSATINCIFGQCETLDQIMFYRNLLMQILDDSIRTIKIQNPQKQDPS